LPKTISYKFGIPHAFGQREFQTVGPKCPTAVCTEPIAWDGDWRLGDC